MKLLNKVEWQFDPRGVLHLNPGGKARASVKPMEPPNWRANVWTRKGQSSVTFLTPGQAQEWCEFELEDA